MNNSKQRKNKIAVCLALAFLLALAFSMVSFAKESGGGQASGRGPGQGNIPFDIDFNTAGCERLCYAGHPSDKVLYHEGIALPEDTEFYIVPQKKDGPVPDISKLSADVTLLYENEEHTVCIRELVKKIEKGDFKKNEYYPILSETTIESLKERNKLYSDTLKSIEITLSYEKQDKEIKKRYYIYICDDEVYNNLMEADKEE